MAVRSRHLKGKGFCMLEVEGNTRGNVIVLGEDVRP